MVATHPAPKITEIFYPSSDGKPLAETLVPMDAIIHAVVAALQAEVEALQDLAKQLTLEQQRADRAETQVQILMERLKVLGVDPSGEE